jgi:hypothetical protein
MLPPPSAAFGVNPVKVGGRTFTCAAGSTLDAAEGDSQALEANGWTRTSMEGVYTTAARPVFGPNQDGLSIVDSTLGAVIIWDGIAWRNPATGASV